MIYRFYSFWEAGMDETLYKRDAKAKEIEKNKDTRIMKLKFKDRSVDIQAKIYIGRESENQIVLENDPLVSRKHAVIEIIGDKYYIRDLNSTNNTYVNHNPLKKGEMRELFIDDLITIGKTEFKLSKD